MKTLSIKTSIIILTLLLLAPTALLHAQEISTSESESTGLFSNLRERQINNRERIKTNLHDLIADDDASHDEEPVTTDIVDEANNEPLTTTDPVLIFAYRLDTIAERLESHILLSEFNNTAIPVTVEEDFVTAQEELLAVLNALQEKSIESDTALLQLRAVKDSLHDIISALRQVQG